MKHKKIRRNTDINVNDSYEGETIETKIERVTSNNEPIDSTAEIIFTDKKDGVQAGYNVRTDRFEIALDAMDKISKSNQAKRDNEAAQLETKGNGKPETTQDDIQESA